MAKNSELTLNYTLVIDEVEAYCASTTYIKNFYTFQFYTSSLFLRIQIKKFQLIKKNTD